ncbi:preprotein translocase subunit SecE [uncultured Roseburia sp.]|uniref:Protein translocase subunit SecE n=1 Tax=Brotonthovivens ammoniilytica TaxID=2981725 RepID=A0ABT2TIR5_9FIRM|nr:preprotein translocase subunit SecE [Brotonthovivens ammoniilytica]MCU6762103.1 preprotein translocase subunit SecE [Brotonthovivens ammoniilytica]SCI55828.1 preprotein translocase subunit SecE [uncultured Roseburia sp.]
MGEKNQEKTPKTSWFGGLKAEFGKVVWPDKKSLGKQTIAVIIVCIILGIIIAVLDFGIQHGVDFLINL